ncbi:hypothetical protein EC991_010000 [Linnemannia zychae]|nr:hypothetical protein EC991_010000 [Linnemannia zychae]
MFTSKFAMNTLPALIEQGNDLPFDEREAHTAIPSQPAAHSPPVYVRPANYQDLVVGHQKRHTTPSTPKSPRKLSFNPYRRQSPSSVSKGSPSAEEKRVRYMQERIKVKIQTKNLIAKFKNNSTSDGTGGALSPKSKEGRPAIDSRFAVDGKVAMSVEEDIIDLTSPAPPAGASVSTASEEIVLRAPSRIPRATRAQHRSKTARTHHKGGAVTNAEKLKSLTASQLLRRMNKYLLGTSKLPVLSRTIVQKGLSASLHLAARKPTVGILSSLSPVPLTSISGTTSDIIPATTSTAASTPTATAVQAIAVESTFDTTEDQVTAGATPPTAAGEVVAMATSTKKSNRAAPVTKSGRVTRSIVSDKFRRVTRSTTVAVSQKL